MSTKIQWTEETWNPTTGCDRVSPGCDHCYAVPMAARLKGKGIAAYQTDGDSRTSGPGFGLAMHPDRLEQPLRWRTPRRVFVNSMSDLFHPQVPYEFLVEVFAVMAATPQHTYQVLTKRPKRMRSIVDDEKGATTFARRVEFGYEKLSFDCGIPYAEFRWPLLNVWLGTSVENQKYADQRIPPLLDTPAAVRFISAEPLLGPINLRPRPPGQQHLCIRCGQGPDVAHHHSDGYRTRGIDWVIVGGESGPGARPMNLDWARSIVEQCRRAGVAPFVKQLGSRWGRDHHDIDRFPPDLQVREYPQVVQP